MAGKRKPTPPADAWEMWGDDARYERNRITGDFRLNTSPWAQELARLDAQSRREGERVAQRMREAFDSPQYKSATDFYRSAFDREWRRYVNDDLTHPKPEPVGKRESAADKRYRHAMDVERARIWRNIGPGAGLPASAPITKPLEHAMSVSSNAEGEASKKGLSGAAKRQYVGGAINRARHEKAHEKAERDVAYAQKQDKIMGLRAGTHEKLLQHGFYVLEPQAHGGPWTIYREDGKLFRGITERGAAGGESSGVRAVYSRKDVEAFADLIAANPGAVTPRTRKAQEELAITHTREGRLELPAPVSRAKKQAHSYHREAIADARSQIRYHEAQIAGLREGVKQRREMAETKPSRHGKVRPEGSHIKLTPIRTIRGYQLDATRRLDPYDIRENFGASQTPTALSVQTPANLSEAVDVVQERTGRTYTGSRKSRQGMYDWILDNMDAAPAPRAAPATRPLAQPAQPKRAPRPKKPPTLNQQIKAAGGYVPKTPAEKLRKTPVREMTDAQLLRDWENHPPERRRGVLEREMARRQAKAAKATPTKRRRS